MTEQIWMGIVFYMFLESLALASPKSSYTQRYVQLRRVVKYSYYVRLALWCMAIEIVYRRASTLWWRLYIALSAYIASKIWWSNIALPPAFVATTSSYWMRRLRSRTE